MWGAEGEEEDRSPLADFPFAGDETQTPQTSRWTTETGRTQRARSGTPLEFGITRGAWAASSSGLFLPDSPLAAEPTAQRDSRRLQRKPYLVKVFVAVTQRDRPAINSAGGGTEINAKLYCSLLNSESRPQRAPGIEFSAGHRF